MASRKLKIEDYVGKTSTDLTSAEYHGLGGTYSSSQLKTMLEDPELFYKTYITREIPKKDSTAFNVGTYFHTAVLEPEKLEIECAVYDGIRNGGKWDTFLEENKDKCIITTRELPTANDLVQSVKNSAKAMELLNASKPEVSCFAELYIMEEDIFGFRDGVCYMLSSVGWVPTSGDYEEEMIKDFAVKVIVKVRADALSESLKSISDLKSTSGNAVKPSEMKQAVDDYHYVLSASFYLDIFSLVLGVEFETFNWIFASKTFKNSKTYRCSDKNVREGREQWAKAITLIAKYQSTNWKFQEEIGEI